MDTRFVTRLTVVTALAAASVFGSLAAAPAPAAHALPMVTDDGGPSLDLSPQDEADLQLLKQIVVDRFSATPTVVRPFDVVTLSWQVRLPEDPRAADITLYAGGSQVGTEGSAMVQITSLSARPGLVARLGRVQRVVAAAQVSVDTSACQHIAVSEAMLTAWVNSLLDQLPEEHRSRLYDRNAVVTISESGVRVRVTAGVSIDNWTDPAGTFPAAWIMPSGGSISGDIHILGLNTVRYHLGPGAIWEGTLQISIPAGSFE